MMRIGMTPKSNFLDGDVTKLKKKYILIIEQQLKHSVANISER